MNEANTAWILVSTALVLFMTLPGLALFYAGLVGSKNTLSTLAQCFVIACTASIIWFIAGYSLAFNGDGLYFGNLDKMFLSGITIESLSGDIPETLFVMFQMTFAIITPALIVGAYVERIKFSAVILITAIWLIFVYSPVTHWVWGGGWLSEMGVMDFAGGLVVHTTAGISALVIAKILGSRNGFPKSIKPPHSPVIAMIGAAMLWIGWFGFNAGSALGANQSAAMAMLVTHISAASATVTWMTIDWYKNGKPGLVGMITGMVAGLATVTPASGYIGPIGGLILGISSGIICYWFVGFVKNAMNIDDSLDVFAVHGVGGILGTLLCGLLATSSFGGLGLDSSVWDQTKVQLIGVISISLYTLIVTTIIVIFVKNILGLRVSDQEENTEGCDFGSHGESSYHL
ncbi:MAG TPA: ammonia channel protein [Maribacter sp.]|nr:ammonia channel protein [Maribacter sp.]|tara:strand:+ start:1477 stop:2682 length:1206 start_codon:yes stop_codon:yes gene_type:complete